MDSEKPINPNFDELITLDTAAKISGLSHDHLRRLAGQGKLWAKKIGRDWVTTEQSLKDYLTKDRKSGPKKTN